jgi:hypothetical protein
MITPVELEGGWRRLCAAMIRSAADDMVERALPPVWSKSGLAYRVEQLSHRRVAAGWVNGQPAAVPFAEACDALNIDEDYARQRIDDYLAARNRAA